MAGWYEKGWLRYRQCGKIVGVRGKAYGTAGRSRKEQRGAGRSREEQGGAGRSRKEQGGAGIEGRRWWAGAGGLG